MHLLRKLMMRLYLDRPLLRFPRLSLLLLLLLEPVLVPLSLCRLRRHSFETFVMLQEIDLLTESMVVRVVHRRRTCRLLQLHVLLCRGLRSEPVQESRVLVLQAMLALDRSPELLIPGC